MNQILNVVCSDTYENILGSPQIVPILCSYLGLIWEQPKTFTNRNKYMRFLLVFSVILEKEQGRGY
jgi:hypothetical protein